MTQHYIIGDVHGEYQTLLTLISQLPKNAELIFVGDLIDRGDESREVVEFVRQNDYRVIMGNHEAFMIRYGEAFIAAVSRGQQPDMNNVWTFAGGIETLRSYDLIEGHYTIINDSQALKNLQNDIDWMKSLPLYLELVYPINRRKVVISHASIGDFWHLRHTKPDDFSFYALSNRRPPSSQSPIFNIYGHTVVPDVVITDSYVSLDTGCGKDREAKLSAFCIETGEVVSVQIS